MLVIVVVLLRVPVFRFGSNAATRHHDVGARGRFGGYLRTRCTIAVGARTVGVVAVIVVMLLSSSVALRSPHRTRYVATVAGPQSVVPMIVVEIMNIVMVLVRVAAMAVTLTAGHLAACAEGNRHGQPLLAALPAEVAHQRRRAAPAIARIVHRAVAAVEMVVAVMVAVAKTSVRIDIHLRHQAIHAHSTRGTVNVAGAITSRAAKHHDTKQRSAPHRLVVPIPFHEHATMRRMNVSRGGPNPTWVLPGPVAGRPSVGVASVSPTTWNPETVVPGRR